MNYQDTLSWPDIPVDEVDREELETLFSFGHYDGPGTGLISWDDKYYYVKRFEIRDNRYWIIELTEEQQKYAFWYGLEWAKLFHSGCSWNADGTKQPLKLGIHAKLDGKKEDSFRLDDEVYCKFSREVRHPEPSKDARVIGYFTHWKK